jgi:hypothetical protein
VSAAPEAAVPPPHGASCRSGGPDGGRSRPALTVAPPLRAQDGGAPGAPGGPPTPRAARPVTVRLAPTLEPPARTVRATTPAHTVPPVLGSPEARRRLDVTSRPFGGPAAALGPMPDPTPLCCAMVQAAVEGLRGVRPLAQLTRWVTPEVYEHLQIRAELVQRAGRPVAARAGIRRIRLFRIGDDVAEASVVVDDGPRVRAVAIRLEGHRGRWRAVVLEIG